jgi:mandelate racemase
MAAPLGSPPPITARFHLILFPDVSAHLMAAPGHLWLEYVDWADPILHALLRIKNGAAIVPERLGNGQAWKNDMVARYRLV